MSRRLPELVSQALRPARLVDFIALSEAEPSSVTAFFDARGEGFVNYQRSLLDRYLRVLGPWSSADEPLRAARLLVKLLRERKGPRGKGGRPATYTREQLAEIVAALERDRVRFGITPGRGAMKTTIERAVGELESERGKPFRASESKRIVTEWQKIVSDARTKSRTPVNPKTSPS